MTFKSSPLVMAVGLLCASVTIAEAASRGKPQCYLWADQATAALNTPYEPSPAYSFNKKKLPVSVTRAATGRYTVTCGGVGGGDAQGPGGHVQVTAHGSASNAFCHVGSWVTGGTDFSATVYCYSSAGGAAADSRFNLLFLR